MKKFLVGLLMLMVFAVLLPLSVSAHDNCRKHYRNRSARYSNAYYGYRNTRYRTRSYNRRNYYSGPQDYREKTMVYLKCVLAGFAGVIVSVILMLLYGNAVLPAMGGGGTVVIRIELWLPLILAGFASGFYIAFRKLRPTVVQVK